ncbi:EfeM/EfeO family lipoprotein [Solirubrobacter soli]|uniref:EfeM/EfeO family lipoprotein n=1 Tax=Solirubrobacter soli TaxID=363832 RepID=UPI00040BEEC6|nr:EfeM/EfeO family lipoprotein [Solirubrobacter soli]
MRRAALIAVLCLAGCGGGQATPEIRHPIAPPASTDVPAARVSGTNRSAAEVAASASELPVDGVPRPEFSPVSERAFDRPIARYRVYSTRQAAAMDAAIRVLQRSLRAGDRAAARRAWISAYDHYLRIGAAYGALGDLDASIVAGRERLERGLWTGERLAALRPAAARLRQDVRTLRGTVTRVEITPVDYTTRGHEILEDAQRDMLSGVAAPYSGAGVMATAASLAATETVVGTLRALLAQRGAIAPIDSGLVRLRRELAAIRRAHRGRWPDLDALSPSERQRLNGRLGAGLEELAQLPHALETTLPPKIPPIRP